MAYPTLPSGDTGIAASYPGDAGIGGHSSVVFHDTFETYSTHSDMVSGPYLNVYQGDLIDFPADPAVAGVGSKILRIEHEHPRYNNADLPITGVDVVHVRVNMRLSEGFYWLLDGSGYASSAHAGIAISASYDGAGVYPNGTNHYMALFEPTRYRGEAQPGYLHAYVYHMNQGSGFGDHLYSDGVKVPAGSGWTPSGDFTAIGVQQPPMGEWFSVEIRGQANTPGQADGRVTVWLDGVIISDIGDIEFRSTSSLKWDLVQIGVGQGGGLSGSLSGQYVSFDNLVVATEYIGPVYTGASSLSVDADGGSYTVTGSAAEVDVAHVVSADTGSYAITGANAWPLKWPAEWPLATGVWDDTGAWDDTATWYDTPPIEIAAESGAYEITGADAALAVGYVVAAEAGAYTVTGSDAGASVSREVAAEAGSYEIAGSNATLDHVAREWLIATGVWDDGGIWDDTAIWSDHPDAAIAADAGSYEITGSDAGVEVGYVVAAEAGAYEITGTDAGVLLGYAVAAGAGEYVVTGSDAGISLEAAGSYALAAESGAYVITGADAALEYGLTISAEAGAYTVTRSDAGVLLGREVSAEVGSYEVTGADAALIVAGAGEVAIAAEAGSYLITGADATLEYGRTVTPDAGSYEVTGSDASLEWARIIVPDAGAYIVTGSPGALEIGRLIAAEAGAYTITGSDAALAVAGPGEIAVIAGGGAYTITGSDAGLERGLSLAADAGVYTITGSDAGLALAHPLSAEAGAYQITGSDAALAIARTMGAEVGAYEIVGGDAAVLVSSVNFPFAGDVLIGRAPSGTLVGRAATTILRGQ